jgi:hypothetical protein
MYQYCCWRGVGQGVIGVYPNGLRALRRVDPGLADQVKATGMRLKGRRVGSMRLTTTTIIIIIIIIIIITIIIITTTTTTTITVITIHPGLADQVKATGMRLKGRRVREEI